MRCPNCQYEAIGEEMKQCINCGYLFPQSETDDPTPSQESAAETNNLDMSDDELSIDNSGILGSMAADSHYNSEQDKTDTGSEDELEINNAPTTPDNKQPDQLLPSGQNIKKLSDADIKNIEQNLYQNDDELISQKDKSSIIDKLNGIDGDKPDKPVLANTPIIPPQRDSKEPVDIQEADKAMAEMPKPQFAKKGRGIAHYYKNYIQLVGSMTIHPEDELKINGREYILKPKKIKPTYLYAGTAGLFIVCLMIIGSLFIGSTSSGNGSIVGMILDEYDQPFITGAQVRLADINQSVKSNGQGFFRFNDIPPGSYRIQYMDGNTVVGEDYITVTAAQTSMIALNPSLLSMHDPVEENNSTETTNPGNETKPDPPIVTKKADPPAEKKITNTTTTKKKTKNTKKKKSNTPGKVRLTANVDGAKFVLDGTVMGAGNLTYKNIKPGKHAYTVSTPGYEKYTGKFEMKPGETKTLQVTLTPITQAKKEKSYDKDDYYYAAQNAFNEGKYKVAIEDLSKVIEAEPGHADAYFTRAKANKKLKKNSAAYDDFIRAAEIYQFRKDYNHAISCYNYAIEINPKNANAYLGRGNLFLHKKESLAAMADFDKVTNLEKRNFYGYYGLGEARFQQEQYKKAVKHFKDARSIDSDNPLVHQYLMLSYMFINDPKNVKKSYEKFVKVANPEEINRFESSRKYSAVRKIIAAQN